MNPGARILTMMIAEPPRKPPHYCMPTRSTLILSFPGEWGCGVPRFTVCLGMLRGRGCRRLCRSKAAEEVREARTGQFRPSKRENTLEFLVLTRGESSSSSLRDVSMHRPDHKRLPVMWRERLGFGGFSLKGRSRSSQRID